MTALTEHLEAMHDSENHLRFLQIKSKIEAAIELRAATFQKRGESTEALMSNTFEAEPPVDGLTLLSPAVLSLSI